MSSVYFSDMPRTRGSTSGVSARGRVKGSYDDPSSSGHAVRRDRQRLPMTASECRRRVDYRQPAREEPVHDHDDDDDSSDDEAAHVVAGDGFPGGPYDTSLLVRYEQHAAHFLSDGHVIPILYVLSLINFVLFLYT